MTATDVLPGTLTPHFHIYQLSITEQKFMKDYIQETLQQGDTGPSTLPASTGLFLMEKKGGGLRSCIDCTGVNHIAEKYPYPPHYG